MRTDEKRLRSTVRVTNPQNEWLIMRLRNRNNRHLEEQSWFGNPYSDWIDAEKKLKEIDSGAWVCCIVVKDATGQRYLWKNSSVNKEGIDWKGIIEQACQNDSIKIKAPLWDATLTLGFTGSNNIIVASCHFKVYEEMLVVAHQEGDSCAVMFQDEWELESFGMQFGANLVDMVAQVKQSGLEPRLIVIEGPLGELGKTQREEIKFIERRCWTYERMSLASYSCVQLGRLSG